MTQLIIYHEQNNNRPVWIGDDEKEVENQLSKINVMFEKWSIRADTECMTQEDILTAYKPEIDTLCRKYKFESVDVMKVQQTHNKPEIRNKFLAEHTHDDREIRYFISGSGLFYLHVGESVYGLLCTAGDLIDIPANMKHWFDIGNPAEFCAIRFFPKTDGWIASYTGDKLALDYPIKESPLPEECTVLLTDIEGTIAPITFVKDVLFPFSKNKLSEFIYKNVENETVKPILEQCAKLMQLQSPSLHQICDQCIEWIDTDQKITPLKSLQGLIWQAGYESGELKAPIFTNAFNYLLKCYCAGVTIYSYSSGSCLSQKLFYTYSTFGNIMPFFKGLYDTTIGPKKDFHSYEKIVSQINEKSEKILFLSDNNDEVQAALKAGLKSHLVTGEEYFD